MPPHLILLPIAQLKLGARAPARLVNVIKEAIKLDRNIDLPMWMSTLTLDDQTIGGMAAINDQN